MKVAFTMDVDWAPDFMIDFALNFFSKKSVPCTIFATHETDALKNLGTQFEIGVHPNFNPCLLNSSSLSASEILDTIMEKFPTARGVRSHSMTQSTPLLDLFMSKGLMYDSNQFLPYMCVKPYRSWNGLVRIPYNWEDDIHFEYGNEFDNLNLNMSSEYLILDFHPVHLYLNTNLPSLYKNAKPHFRDKNLIQSFRNFNAPGAGTALEDSFRILDGFSKMKLIDIAKEYIQ